MILGVFLHDIGHLVGMKNDFPSMGEVGTQNHEIVENWDDRGKIYNAPVDPLEKYENMCKVFLKKCHFRF